MADTTPNYNIIPNDNGTPNANGLPDDNISPVEAFEGLYLALEHAELNMEEGTDSQALRYEQVIAQYVLKALLLGSDLPAGRMSTIRDVGYRIIMQDLGPLTRVEFIQALAPTLIHMTSFQMARFNILSDQSRFLSAEARFFRYCKWILQGRRDHDHWNRPIEELYYHTSHRSPDLSLLPFDLTAPTTCAYCGDEEVNLVCIHCAQINCGRLTIATPYCSEDCQRVDWKNHEEVCITRRGFSRSVQFMKSIFMTLEDTISVIRLSGSHQQENVIVLHETSRHLDAMRGVPVFQEFPQEDFATEEHAYAAIHDSFASEIPHLMQGPLAKWLWTDLCVNVELVMVRVKNAHVSVIRTHEDRYGASTIIGDHWVVRVTLKSGELFAVDFAGGRFGWTETLMHWSHFEQHRVSAILATTHRNYGSAQLHIPLFAKTHLHCLIQILITDFLEEVMDFPLPTPFDQRLLGGVSKELYARLERKLLRKARHICKFMFRYCIDGYYRLYPNIALTDEVAWTQEATDYLQGVWMTEDQVNQLQNWSKDDLRGLWMDHTDALGFDYDELREHNWVDVY
ncbi:hypothetical protein GGR54DRAFT_655065 [Hypoxylon sp. NC1633]|nr:hypothetical protein GGR54DRAFT_655065 [Hypoxylon sp. NC1633]